MRNAPFPDAGFNTQPPEGGWACHADGVGRSIVSTHSRPKAAGVGGYTGAGGVHEFQHTAARRRLGHLNLVRL